MKSSHMLLCAVLLLVGIALLATGVGGIGFLPFVACMLMMGGMMWFTRARTMTARTAGTPSPALRLIGHPARRRNP